ncbi:MAG: hypothetical protein M5U26_30305 [Planctomycetota bacterium]|nr:hypothetical protein [Planctomycetota bacterium]
MDLSSILDFARPQVKDMLRVQGTLWLGSHAGLFRLDDQRLVAAEGWSDGEIKALGPAPLGFYVAIKRGKCCEVHRCGADGRSLDLLPALTASDLKCVSGLRSVWAGAKKGVYRLRDKAWQPVYVQDSCEVARVEEREDGIWVFCKKHGPEMTPAVLRSKDDGATWETLWTGAYHDAVLAASPALAVTRWRHKVKSGENGKYKKTPITAAVLLADGKLAVLDGHKLRIERPGHSTIEAKHPVFAEAEHLDLERGRAIVAGGQGAYSVDLTNGTVLDLFSGHPVPDHSYHIKKLYALKPDSFLAATSFGTFRSVDKGDTWAPVSGDWTVHDSEGLARAEDGTFFLACQRGLFASRDDGLSWKHEKFDAVSEFWLELTGITAFAGGVALSSKNGLYLWRAEEPKLLRRVESLGALRVSLVTPSAEALLAVAEDRGVYRVEPGTGQTHKLGVLPASAGEVGALWEERGIPWVQAQWGVFVLRDAGFVACPLPSTEGPWHGQATTNGVLLWNAARAWLRKNEGWASVEGWPGGPIKKVVLASGGAYVLATDRKTIYRLPVSESGLVGASH